MLEELNDNMCKLTKLMLIFVIFSLLISMVNATISKTIDVNVIETRNVNLLFTPVYNTTPVTATRVNNFNTAVNRNTAFFQDIYPVSDEGLNYKKDYVGILAPESLSDWSIFRYPQLTLIRGKILTKIFLEKQKFTNAVGVVEEGYLAPHDGATGLKFGDIGKSDVILVDESQLKTTAHEVGHTFGLCDEYRNDYWDDQNDDIVGGCPNGDIDGDGGLDRICRESSGCPTQTFSILYQDYGNILDDTSLRNFMGGRDHPNEIDFPDIFNFQSWISSSSFNVLLDRFDVNSNFTIPLFRNFEDYKSDYVLIRIFFEKDGAAEVLDSYILNDGFVHNKNEYSGNFTLEVLDENGGLISDINFEPEFKWYTDNGGVTETNSTFIIFSLPLNNKVLSKIVFKEAAIKLAEVSKTPNSPIITVVSPVGGEVYYKDFTINWSASDADNDKLSYAVLLSNDNGNTWSTLAVDYDQTNFLVNVSYLDEGDKYLVKVLATDGINTGEDVSDSAFTISRKVLSPYELKLEALNNEEDRNEEKI